MSGERSLFTRLDKSGLMGSAQRGPTVPVKVNSLLPNPQLLIALHSPNGLRETGLCMCLTEKTHASSAFDDERSVLCSPVCLGIIAKYGRYSHVPVQSERSFSAVQTAWRSGVDSNPRYRSEWRKSRRLRKLRGINWFTNSPADCLLPTRHAKHCGLAKLLEAKRWRLCG